MNKYRITYYFDNGLERCNQTKTLISHDLDYLPVIKPTEKEIYSLEVRVAELGKKNKEVPILRSKINALKKHLKELYPFEWFTDKSPLWKDRESGLLFGKYMYKVVLLK